MSNDSATTRLEALGDFAKQVDGDNPTPEQQQEKRQEQARESAAEQGATDWGMVLFTVGGVCSMIAPELRPLYSEERCLEWGRCANAVAEKYGWNSPSNMPELALLASTVTFAAPTAIVLTQRIKELKAAKDGSLWAKIGMWWRARKSKAAPTADAPEGTGDGVKQ